jgi:hypothetical protein
VPERSALCPALAEVVPVVWALVEAGTLAFSVVAVFAFVCSAPVIALLSFDVVVLAFALALCFCPRDRLVPVFLVVELSLDVLEFCEVSPVF